MSQAWLVLAAAVLWGTTGTAQALAPTGADPISIGTLRLVVGGVALLAGTWLRKGWPRLERWSFKLLVFTSLTIATYQLAFFGGVARSGVAVGTIVGIGSAPMMAGVLSWLVNGERPGNRWLGATVLAILGCGLLVLPGSAVQINALGVVLSLGAGLSYALYTLSSKRLLESYPPDTVMAVVFCGGALLLLPLLVGRDLKWTLEPHGLVVVLHLGLIATGLAYALFGRGLKTTPAAVAVTLSLAEPLTAGVLGIVVVGEQLTTTTLVGIGLMLGGLAWLTLPGGFVGRRYGLVEIEKR